MEGILVLAAIIGAAILITKIFSWIGEKIKEDAQSLFESRKRELEKEIGEYKANIEKELEKKITELKVRETHLLKLKSAFQNNFCSGREWLAAFIAEADKALDDQIALSLEYKKHPAVKAAEAVKEANAEKRRLKKQVKLLEFQLKTYTEYFPFLEEFEEEIINEELDFSQDDDAIDGDFDRALNYLTPEEYSSLPASERNQMALDRYLKKTKSNWEIGRLYERFIGYKYEQDGWDVGFIGAIKGYEDMGRDLICKKGPEVQIVQAKCWSQNKTIHEKHIFQLFGTTICYELENGLLPGFVKPVFITTTSLSPVALTVASKLGIDVQKLPLQSRYPMIKCNINQRNKIYHLPFDQMYDRVKISQQGEIYCDTTQEAEQNGFRRAKKYYDTKKA